jgi:hypothetical protein
MGFKKEFDWDSHKVSSVDIGGRYNFGATLWRFRPFVEAAFSFNSLDIDPITLDGINVFALKSSGIGGSIGGGVHFFIIPNLSISVNGRITFGNFNKTKLSGDLIENLGESLDYTVSSLQLGVSYFFD